MTRLHTRWFALLALLAWSACGGGDNNPNGPDGGGGGCSVAISLVLAAPTAPTVVAATASITDGSGFVTVSWDVTGPAGAVATTPTSADETSIEFTADIAGPYEVHAAATVGGQGCTAMETVNVLAPGGRRRDLRLRYTPLAAQPAPAQDDPQLVAVYGGSPMTIPDRTLDDGTLIDALLAGPAGPLAAYLRLDPLGLPTGAHPLELFAAAADGAYAARLPGGVYDLLVVPLAGTVAPLRLDAQSVALLGAGYTLDAGDAIGGTLLASDGVTPVAGARIAIAAGDLPAVVATTAADGTWQAVARVAGGDPLAITVVPADASGFPQLALPASAGLVVAPGAQVVLGLADAPVVVLAATVTHADGTPFPNVPVTFIASSFAAAGTLSVDGAPAIAIPTAARVTIDADATGALTVALPQALYTVVLAPDTAVAGQAVTQLALDLTAGAPVVPPVLATVAIAPYTLHVTDQTGADVPDAHVSAVARGLAGVGMGTTVDGLTDAAGALALPLSAGVGYDFVVDPPRGVGVARARLVVDGGGAAGLLALPASLPVSGTLLFAAGTGAAGVRVAAYCTDCDPGEDPTQPLAETISGAGGAFQLDLPDPGITP